MKSVLAFIFDNDTAAVFAGSRCTAACGFTSFSEINLCLKKNVKLTPLDSSIVRQLREPM